MYKDMVYTQNTSAGSLKSENYNSEVVAKMKRQQRKRPECYGVIN